MLRPRIIPCLLIHQGGLVKTTGFSDPRYVGDPINAVRIFNEKEADELIVLDIDATARGADPDYGLISRIAAECRMPLCYGGGITRPEQASKIVGLGVEKVSMSAAALADPWLVTRTAEEVGSQSVVVTLDVRRRRGFRARGYELRSVNAMKGHRVSPFEGARAMEAAGAGEIVLNSIDADGRMQGYDLTLASEMRSAIDIPLTLLGGAGSNSDIEALLRLCGVVGAAAGSLFVFKGPYRAVLITYPEPAAKDLIAASAWADDATSPR